MRIASTTCTAKAASNLNPEFFNNICTLQDIYLQILFYNAVCHSTFLSLPQINPSTAVHTNPILCFFFISTLQVPQKWLPKRRFLDEIELGPVAKSEWQMIRTINLLANAQHELSYACHHNLLNIQSTCSASLEIDAEEFRLEIGPWKRRSIYFATDSRATHSRRFPLRKGEGAAASSGSRGWVDVHPQERYNDRQQSRPDVDDRRRLPPSPHEPLRKRIQMRQHPQ